MDCWKDLTQCVHFPARIQHILLIPGDVKLQDARKAEFDVSYRDGGTRVSRAEVLDVDRVHGKFVPLHRRFISSTGRAKANGLTDVANRHVAPEPRRIPALSRVPAF